MKKTHPVLFIVAAVVICAAAYISAQRKTQIAVLETRLADYQKAYAQLQSAAILATQLQDCRVWYVVDTNTVCISTNGQGFKLKLDIPLTPIGDGPSIQRPDYNAAVSFHASSPGIHNNVVAGGLLFYGYRDRLD